MTDLGTQHLRDTQEAQFLKEVKPLLIKEGRAHPLQVDMKVNRDRKGSILQESHHCQTRKRKETKVKSDHTRI